MNSPEDEFVHELEVFGAEAEAATRFFFTWRTVHDVLSEDESVLEVLNETSSFWHTVLDALLTASFITLGRVSDRDSRSHGVDRLLEIGKANLSILSKKALARRKQRVSPKAHEWLPAYLSHVYVPNADDFVRLEEHVHTRRSIYKAKYDPLRNKVFAHTDALTRANVQVLFARTKNREMQQLLTFLGRLHDALWNLLYNGRKPNLRPARYAVGRMRKRPSPPLSHHTTREEIVRETERFLKSLVRERH